MAREITDILSEKKGEDIVLLDTRAASSIADYFVIATAGSVRQIKAITDEVSKTLKKKKKPPLGIEGVPESGWVLMDYGAVLVHIFDPGTRDYYDLEGLWNEAKVIAKIQ